MTALATDATIPAALSQEINKPWEDLQQRCDTLDWLYNADAVWHSLPKVWACSPFVARQCVQSPDIFADLVSGGDLERAYTPGEMLAHGQALLAEEQDETAFMRNVRLLRRREMLRIAWRDLAGWADLRESLRDLSDLADSAIQSSIAYLRASLKPRFGEPCDAAGQVQPLVVLAMGKLGGQELNFSSDIDLIFAYPQNGLTQGGRKELSNQEYFVRLGQKLGHVLNTPTADGFVFRVDLRLRPFGDSGPLAMHFSALEDYYQAHAREWERYALIKARALSEQPAAASQLWDMLRPFVFRRYLDFGAFEALRDLKTQIDQEVRRKGFEHNIKLGPGGIREVEFICQAFQLLRGGRQPALQTRHLLTTLERLGQYHLLPAAAVEELREAYVFLRLAENRLQAIDDQQTQNLPADELNRARLALAMNFPDWDSFSAEINRQQALVSRHFQQVIVGDTGTPGEEQGPALKHPHHAEFRQLWETVLPAGDEARALEILEQGGFADPAHALNLLQGLRDSAAVRKSSKTGIERLANLMPLLLAEIIRQEHQQAALERVLSLIESVARRSVYLSLLIESQKTLEQLVMLCSSSDWIAAQISRYPLLLDELLDNRRAYDMLKPEELDNALQAQLAHVPTDDLELQMDTLRHFKRAQMLHVAAAELSGQMTVEVASDYITAVADCMVRQALGIAWTQMVEKHGQPMCAERPGDDASLRRAGFAIAAYGKAGGIEMSYSSDLDIVFLHDSSGGWQATDGDRSIDNNVFFARLAKRIVHLLTTQTAAGPLYEVDQRLRPGGNSGLLVSSLDAFLNYQLEEAWTWEHQAIVRARGVAGDPDCLARFEAIRAQILQLPRDPEALKQEVIDMRRKMRDNLDKSTAELFDLKQGVGGITDIEFMVQYAVLCWAKDHPDLLTTTGLLPMLQRFVDSGHLTPGSGQRLGDAYRHYRAETHRLALQSQKAIVDGHLFVEDRLNVSRLWSKIMGEV